MSHSFQKVPPNAWNFYYLLFWLKAFKSCLYINLHYLRPDYMKCIVLGSTDPISALRGLPFNIYIVWKESHDDNTSRVIFEQRNDHWKQNVKCK